MRVLRRVVFPIVWILIFSVIAVALVKIAFIDGLNDSSEEIFPEARVEAPVIEASRATVTNTVELTGTVESDSAVPVRSTAAGKVVHFFVDQGAQLSVGERIFQIRSEVMPEPSAVVVQESDDDEGSGAPRPAPGPIYSYTNVLATATGTLETLTVLMDQDTSVGESVGTISPGTFSIRGSLTTAQQFRLMGKPTTATGTVTNGPAPFSCQNVQLSNADAPANSAAPNDQNPGVISGPGTDAGTGQVSCAIPTDVTVFPGLGATINLTAGEAKDVLTLPLTAVKGSVQNGIVWISSVDGSAAPEEREVVLGLSDGSQVEIASGLAEGEQVLEFVPGTDALMPDGQMSGFGMMGG